MTSEQLDDLEHLARTSGRKLHPDKALALIARVRKLEAERDRLAAEVAQLTADLESHDVETQRQIATLTREFNESYTRLAAENERLKAGVVVDGETSDGYHTFNELYAYRKALHALLANEWARRGLYDVHKSWHHSDGEPCFGGGWFIVVAELPEGQVSNHYKAADWALFQVPERERGNTYDGHTPAIALERLLARAALAEAPTPAREEILMGKRERGLFNKFRVERVDGTDTPGQKHDGCEYFVLDLTHDPFALPAIRAYADACRAEYPLLARDLDAKAAREEE